MPRIIAILLLTAATALQCQKVGASMSLEGRAALTRAAQFLCLHQQEDGTWNDDLPLTATAGDILRKCTASCEDDSVAIAVGKALAAVRKRLPEIAPADKVRVLAILVAAQDTADTPVMREILMADDIAPNQPDIVETADALHRAAGLLNTELPRAIREKLLRAAPATKAGQLAMAIIAGNETPGAIKVLYSAARAVNAYDASFRDLYWLARSCQACNAAKLIPYDNWKSDIIAALLHRQRGTGAWSTPEQPAPDAVRDTALAMQTVILCLAD